LVTLPQPILVAVVQTGSADDEYARDRDQALEEVRRARERAGWLPLKVVRFQGVGHNLMRYGPDALSRRLLDLLEEAALSPSDGTPGGPA
ncbi:MAG: hypothetical protein H0W07_06940, partial [Chloroflexi bacterium]|nr:hypothetical protein [Chloroflexota bacterium]